MADNNEVPSFFNDTYRVDINTPKFDRASIMIPRVMVEQLEKQPLFGNFLITWAGYYSRADRHYADRTDSNNYFPDYILHYCESGSGFVMESGHYEQIGSGDLFLCRANAPHQYGSSVSDPWSVFWACFRGRNVPQMLHEIGFRDDKPVIHLGPYHEINNAFFEIFDALRSTPTSHNVLFASTRFFSLLSKISLDLFLTKNASITNIDINSILNIMYRNVDSNLSLDYFANTAGLSRYYFERYFTKVVGNTVMDQFALIKMNKACELLTTTNMTIKEISYKLAFNTPYHFSRRFKQLIGYTPQQYRNIFGRGKNHSMNISARSNIDNDEEDERIEANGNSIEE